MKKPHSEHKKRYHNNNNSRFKGKPVVDYTSEFDNKKLQTQSGDVIELFKMIQAVRYDRTSFQELYNESRQKLNNDRMNLESEVIKLKKHYNARITALQEEYNSVKSNNKLELARLREG
ncbi:hypothetical protein [Francisella adeliensis]|uniref:Uncharacterized protein n=1 Tax=Francisella adeliensis TaxID=2007306 RepID=A0A2Z4XYG8_9GAMM|nr:hypothetical protein [Francisella adeliensis]AXA33532.1 hypothetical protein CDH04_03490 [Francisella adeliensis]MBK2084766.1 hypothetical protein [Francisella adeliensis]MBK2097291.1 hypothetical protein [Francisella adeliensis]QIW11764.1 hypothetical protein FZC43_03490 [Francisella adeliensis]QIW13639.1 hypothetical protein FZC44_03490 [Francisella adeliensis]